jgi:hypothetical protein
MLGVPSIYSPEELVFFRRVMDEAVASLPAAARTSDAKAKIARRLLEGAAAGERDRVELLVAALADFRHHTSLSGKDGGTQKAAPP